MVNYWHLCPISPLPNVAHLGPCHIGPHPRFYSRFNPAKELFSFLIFFFFYQVKYLFWNISSQEIYVSSLLQEEMYLFSCCCFLKLVQTKSSLSFNVAMWKFTFKSLLSFVLVDKFLLTPLLFNWKWIFVQILHK